LLNGYSRYTFGPGEEVIDAMSPVSDGNERLPGNGVDATPVRRLIVSQCPRWAHLSVRPVEADAAKAAIDEVLADHQAAG
jgi:hypothetical protein